MPGLTQIQRQEYTLHKTAIEAGMGEVRPHVVAIWEKRLYVEHGSFEQFCHDVGISRACAYDWIKQARVSTTVGAPVSQAQARALAQVKPEFQKEIHEAAGGEAATAEKVLGLIDRLSPKEKAAVRARMVNDGEAKSRRAGELVDAKDAIADITRLLGKVKRKARALPDKRERVELLCREIVDWINEPVEAA